MFLTHILKHCRSGIWLIIILLVLAGQQSSHALPNQQTAYRDSLWKAYHRFKKDDTAGIQVLANIAGNYLRDSLDKTYRYAQEVAAQSRKLNWIPGIIRSHSLMGSAFFETQAWNDALINHRKALQLAHQIGRKDHELTASYLISKTYDYIYMFDTSLHQALDSSLYFKKKALRLISYTKSPEFQANLLSETASNFYDIKRYDTAIVLWKESIKALQGRSKRVCDLGLFWNNLSDGYNHVKKFDSSLYCINEGMKAAMVEKDSTILAILNRAMADYHLAMGNPKKAIPYLVTSVNLSPFKGGNQYMKVLSIVYQQVGMYDSALYYFQEYVRIREEYLGLDQKAEVSRQMMKLTMNQQLQSFNEEIQEKEQEHRANTKKIAAISLVTLFMIALSVLLAISSRKNKRKAQTISVMSDRLSKQNVEIQRSLSEKEILLKEVHHRVKNNLQVVSSLLDLQLSGISEPLVQNAVRVSKSRISAISLIHKQLYQHDNLIDIDIRTYSNLLFEQIQRIYNKDKLQVTLNNCVGNVFLNADVAIALSLILNELFTNSFKYAFEKVANPEITLHLHTSQLNNYVLEYTDNGPGLPSTFDYNRSTTLGMQLIKNLSIQLGGKYEYDTATKKHTILFVYKNNPIAANL